MRPLVAGGLVGAFVMTLLPLPPHLASTASAKDAPPLAPRLPQRIGSTKDAPPLAPRLPQRIAVTLVHGGALTRLQVDGRHLLAREARGAVLADRVISVVEREHLAAAARRALTDPEPSRECRGDETFVSLTVDSEPTKSSAVCGASDPWHGRAADWKALLEEVRLLAAAAPPHASPAPQRQ